MGGQFESQRAGAWNHELDRDVDCEQRLREAPNIRAARGNQFWREYQEEERSKDKQDMVS